jgi:outer membrane protein TolC
MRRHATGHAVVLVGAVVALTRANVAAAQAAGDTLRLGTLQADARRGDPRQRQLQLQETAAALRLRSLAAERMPSLSVEGQAQYQSAVTSIAVPLPGGALPSLPHDTYDAHLGAQQPLFDPTLGSRREVERARLTESRAQIRAALFGLRQELSDAFFAAVALQERIGETDAAIVDLSAQLRETVTRFRNGAALPGDTAAVAATLLQRRQDRLTLSADRAAALARLSELTGHRVSDSTALVAPALASAVAGAISVLDTLRARPEYKQFSAARDRLARQEQLSAAGEQPRVSAYGRLGYGRPGLNMLSSSFQTYWLAGVQLQWTPWRWGTGRRDRELLEIEREIVATNEAAFTRSLRRAVQPSIATIARLDSTLALDDRIVELRERQMREAQSQRREGAITAATYVDRSTELLTARLHRIQHRIELEQARASFLNTLGVEVP